jgi:hypothetical protein
VSLDDEAPNDYEDASGVPVHASSLLAALSDPARLRVFAEIVLGEPADPEGDSDPAEAQPREKAIARLESAGLISRGENGLRVETAAFQTALREVSRLLALRRSPVTSADGRVSALFKDGRLTVIPRPGILRSQLLNAIATQVVPEGGLSERELNERLAAIADDYAAIRRYLVDEGYLRRAPDSSVYWRADATQD